jgi:hypothetical protein
MSATVMTSSFATHIIGSASNCRPMEVERAASSSPRISASALWPGPVAQERPLRIFHVSS